MKRFISGFLFGALLFAVPAIANNSKTVEAFYNNIKLSVYGQIVDTEGNEPFIVGGRTYVPARYVAEAMGGVVKWNETENTVEVIPSSPETTPEPNKLTSDGLEAVYFSAFNSFTEGYYVCYTDIREKYPALGINVSPNNSVYIFHNLYPSNGITVDSYWINNRVHFFFDVYESEILPFLKKQN